MGMAVLCCRTGCRRQSHYAPCWHACSRITPGTLCIRTAGRWELNQHVSVLYAAGDPYDSVIIGEA